VVHLEHHHEDADQRDKDPNLGSELQGIACVSKAFKGGN
jgi:hypothetical protein